MTDRPEIVNVANLVHHTITVGRRTVALQDILTASPPTLGVNGRVSQWAARLQSDETLIPQNDEISARDAAAAAAQAHFEALRDDKDLAWVRLRATRHMQECHAPGLRTGTVPVVAPKTLSDTVFDLPDEEVFLASALVAGGDRA